METVAFYSYKGGVGRSLLLANAARFLAMAGKGVVALDLDFEAPGLHYKLGGGKLLIQPDKRTPRMLDNDQPHGLCFGAVPYLSATADGTAYPPSLDEHMTHYRLPPESSGWLGLIPAGPAPYPNYWAALKELNDKLNLGDPSGRGFMALLDLQARIADELRPDYLLIDARSGVTDLGGLATTVLADTVVCMFAANQESLDGTIEVVKALKAAPRLANQNPIRVVPVLSRTTASVTKHFPLGIDTLLQLTDSTTLVGLPHDEMLGAQERLSGVERKASASSPLYKAYLILFQTLFPPTSGQALSALNRMEAVAKFVAKWTDGPSELDRYLPDPPNLSAIEEGELFKADADRGNESRYADLVWRDKAGIPLLVVEYLAEGAGAGALEFWGESTDVRTVVLLVRDEQRVFVRDADSGELLRSDNPTRP